VAERLRLGAAANRLASDPLAFLADALLRDEGGDTPHTDLLLGTVGGLFVAQLLLALRYGAATPRDAVSYLFVAHPELAWPLAPFLHRGVGHLAVNVVVVALAAPVERLLGRARFVGLLACAGFLPLYAEGAKLALLDDATHVAAYGASGFAFGLVGCGLAAQARRDARLTPRWWLVVLAGVAAVLAVLANVAETALTGPLALNLGHLGGLVAGLGFGWRLR
jgi:membrane associated rhomboid family serine protease